MPWGAPAGAPQELLPAPLGLDADRLHRLLAVLLLIAHLDRLPRLELGDGHLRPLGDHELRPVFEHHGLGGRVDALDLPDDVLLRDRERYGEQTDHHHGYQDLHARPSLPVERWTG